ncbi:MAG: hypothetical protein QXV69_00500 [Sulfolobaceae archaeon]
MPKLVIRGPLSIAIGKKEVEINMKISLYDLFKLVKVYDYIFKDNKLRPDFLVFINGKDWRLFGLNELELKEDDIVEIISINHGG